MLRKKRNKRRCDSSSPVYFLRRLQIVISGSNTTKNKRHNKGHENEENK